MFQGKLIFSLFSLFFIFTFLIQYSKYSNYALHRHGKGAWDGFGGTIKNNSRRRTIDKTLKINGKDRIENARDFYQNMKATFGSDDWTKRHEKNIIRNAVFFLDQSEPDKHGLDFDDILIKSLIKRPPENKQYTTLAGISSHYQFQAIGEGTLLMRRYGCNCVACMEAISFNDTYFKPLNDNQSSTIDCECASYLWRKSSISILLNSNGITVSRKARQTKGKKLASKLNIGDWIASEARNDTIDKFWLGRAVEFQNSGGVCMPVCTRRQTLSGTRFDVGDIGVCVQWYERVPSDANRFTFEDGGRIDIVNAGELRMIGSSEVREEIIVDGKKQKQLMNDHIKKLPPNPMALKVIPDMFIADTTVDTTSIKIGSNIMCKYLSENPDPKKPVIYYPATITAIDNDKYNVKFFDDELRDEVPLSDLKPFIKDRDVVMVEYKDNTMRQKFYKAEINHVYSKVDEEKVIHFVDVMFLQDGVVRKGIDLSVWQMIIYDKPLPHPEESEFQVGSCVSLKLNTSRDHSFVLLEFWHGVIRSINDEDSTYSIQFQHCVERDLVRVPKFTRRLRFREEVDPAFDVNFPSSSISIVKQRWAIDLRLETDILLQCD